MDLAFKTLFGCLRYVSARLPVLAFHRVVPKRDAQREFDLDADSFERQMRWVAAVFRVIPLLDAVRLLREGRLPARTLCITFDDGYRDNLDVAVPILERYGLHATFFITTAYQDGGMMWNDLLIESLLNWPEPELDLRAIGFNRYEWRTAEQRVRQLPTVIHGFKYLPHDLREREAAALYARSGVNSPRLMMNADEILNLHRCGMGIGGHTHSHPILSRLTVEGARTEIATNKARIEEIIGQPLPLFAYPNGKPGLDFTLVHVALVREAGYQAAFSSSPGMAGPGTDAYQLPRFTPWDRTKGRYLARLAQNYFRPGEMVTETTPEVRF